MKELTQKQQDILVFIARYIDKHAFAPVIREIGAHFSISVKGMQNHVAALKKKGYLACAYRRPRTLEILKGVDMRQIHAEATEALTRISEVLEIPLIGVIPAGQPILAEENYDGSVSLHRSLIKLDKPHIALTVRGDSMEGAGIM
jgi:repressor LexA